MGMTNYVLLFWEEVPGDTTLVLVPRNFKFIAEVLDAHGKYINFSEDDDSACAVSAMLAQPEHRADHIVEDVVTEDMIGALLPHVVKPSGEVYDVPDGVCIKHIVNSGFYL